MAKYKPVVGPIAQTPEWKAIRNYDPKSQTLVFGATDAAPALNRSPYKTSLQLYHEKRGEVEEEDFSGNVPAWIGTQLESMILRAYEERYQCVLKTGVPMFMHAKHAFMGCTPDAMRWSDKIVVDAKSSSFRMKVRKTDDESMALHRFGEPGTDQIPFIYLAQAQQQMYVMGVEKADYIVLFDASNFAVYHITLMPELAKVIMESEDELFERIRDGKPPEPNWEHATTKELLRDIYKLKTGTVTVLPDWCHDSMKQLRELNDSIKAASKVRDITLNKLQDALGEHEVGRFLESDTELKRISVRETLWTQSDVVKATENLGKPKREAYTYLREVKRK